MTTTLSVLLCLGLCLGQRMRAEADTLPRPYLWAQNGSLMPIGSSVTLRCRGSREGAWYSIEKTLGSQMRQITVVKSSGREAEFSIPSVTANHAGIYYCLYKHLSNLSRYSDPLELVVTGLYDPPSLSAVPSHEVTSGQTVTLQCHSEQWYDRYALYKDGEPISRVSAQFQRRKSQAIFLIPAVNSTHEGTYQCYTFNSNYPQVWSSPSDLLVLRVTGTSNHPYLPHSPGNPQDLTYYPPNPAPQDYTVGNLISLSLAGLVLLLLGFLLAEAWQSQRGTVSRSSTDP